MEKLTVCQTKKHFDTEFEAQHYANKVEYRFKEEMMAYPCNNHWHITHVDPSLRRGAGHEHWRCPKCKSIMKQSSAAKHKCSIKEVL